jgi:hypothetical protein
MCYFAPQTKVLNNEYKVNQLILNNQEMDEKNTKVRPTIIALNVGETGTLANVRGCAYPKKRHDSVHV